MKTKEYNKPEELDIRPVTEQDMSTLLSLIEELAVYEKLADQVVNNETALRKILFGKKVYVEAEIAYWKGEPVGMVLFFHNYSTFLGQQGLYIEDLFVKEEYRGKGIGKALLLECVRLAKERGCGRVEWVTLHWNPARKFFEKMGAYPMSDWVNYRLDRKAINKLLPD